MWCRVASAIGVVELFSVQDCESLLSPSGVIYLRWFENFMQISRWWMKSWFILKSKVFRLYSRTICCLAFFRCLTLEYALSLHIKLLWICLVFSTRNNSWSFFVIILLHLLLNLWCLNFLLLLYCCLSYFILMCCLVRVVVIESLFKILFCCQFYASSSLWYCFFDYQTYKSLCISWFYALAISCSFD